MNSVLKKVDDNQSFFYQSKQFQQVTHGILLATGESVKLSLTDKTVYACMRDRYVFFTNKKCSYYDSYPDIAYLTGCSADTVERCVRKLKHLGVLSYKQPIVNGNTSNVYTMFEWNGIAGVQWVTPKPKRKNLYTDNVIQLPKAKPMPVQQEFQNAGCVCGQYSCECDVPF